MSDDKQNQPSTTTTTTFKGRGQVLVHGRPTERQPLRRPGGQQATDGGIGGIASVAVANSDPVAPLKSTLSPLAPEFIPNASPSSYLSGGTYYHTGVASSTSSSGASGSSSSSAAPSYSSTGPCSGGAGSGPRSHQQHPTHQQPPPPQPQQQQQQYQYQQQPTTQQHQYVNFGAETEAEITLEYLRTIIYEITVNPGKFDVLASLLVDALSAMLQDEPTLYAIVDQIFEQAVCEANFRYNGARLCNHFSKYLNVSFPSSGFRVALSQRCQQEYVVKDEMVMNNSQRLRDFTMFMGELFIHLEIMLEGSCKVTQLGMAVPQLLKTLLLNPLKDNVKCVCQMLKFTGAALEDYERLRNNDKCPVIDELFHLMGDLCAPGNRVDRNCIELLIKVIDLRAVDWGRVPVQNEPAPILDNPGTDPVMYGPDGLPLSKEEALFLESNSQYYDTNGTEDDGSEIDYYGNTQSSWSTSDGMDEEMVAAFEKFLLETS